MDELVKTKLGLLNLYGLLHDVIQMDNDTLIMVNALLKLKHSKMTYPAPIIKPKRPLDYALEALKKIRAKRKARADRAKTLHTHMLRYKK